MIKKALITPFRCFVRTLLEYGTVLFNPWKKVTIQKLEAVQNCFIRKLVMCLHLKSTIRFSASTQLHRGA